MPEWLQILSVIVPIIVVIISAILGPILVLRVKHTLDIHEKDRIAEEKRHREERKADVLENVGTLIKPLEEKIDNIEQTLLLDKEATILELRVDMKTMRDRIVDNKLTPDTGEKITWKELYKKYYSMGGNHFKEAVDIWGTEMGWSEEELRIFREDAEKENVKKSLNK